MWDEVTLLICLLLRKAVRGMNLISLLLPRLQFQFQLNKPEHTGVAKLVSGKHPLNAFLKKNKSINTHENLHLEMFKDRRDFLSSVKHYTQCA